MSRICARPGCNGAATATLAYDYAAREVELSFLADERHPMTHDLCTHHADTLSVPLGWRHHDRRAPVAPLFHRAG